MGLLDIVLGDTFGELDVLVKGLNFCQYFDSDYKAASEELTAYKAALERKYSKSELGAKINDAAYHQFVKIIKKTYVIDLEVLNGIDLLYSSAGNPALFRGAQIRLSKALHRAELVKTPSPLSESRTNLGTIINKRANLLCACYFNEMNKRKSEAFKVIESAEKDHIKISNNR